MFKILARGMCRQSEVGRGVWEQLPMLGALMGWGRAGAAPPAQGLAVPAANMDHPCHAPPHVGTPLMGSATGVPGVLWGWGDAPAALGLML